MDDRSLNGCLQKQINLGGTKGTSTATSKSNNGSAQNKHKSNYHKMHQEVTHKSSRNNLEKVIRNQQISTMNGNINGFKNNLDDNSVNDNISNYSASTTLAVK